MGEEREEEERDWKEKCVFVWVSVIVVDGSNYIKYTILIRNEDAPEKTLQLELVLYTVEYYIDMRQK